MLFHYGRPCQISLKHLLVMKNPEQIHENDFSLIESYFVWLYSRTRETVKVNELGKILYTNGKSIENIPPTEGALHQHIWRSAYQANVWDQLSAIQELPELSQCGWTKIEGQWGPLWTTLPDVSETLQILASCGCKSSCKSKNRNRCKCFKAGLNCTLLCKCGENCECHF